MKHNVRVHPAYLPGIVGVDAASGRHFTRHSHDQFGIGLMVTGGQISASGRGEVEAEAGELITVNPGEVHDGRPIGEGRAWRMLYFDADLIGRTFARLDRPRGSELQFPVVAAPRLAQTFCALHSDVLTGNLAGAEAGLTNLLAPLLNLREKGPFAIPVSIRRLRAQIDEAPQEPLTLDAAAAEAGLSPWQVLRAFTRLTGLPLHAYQVQARVHTARAHIAAGLTLAEAAAAAGFADQSHMTRQFNRSLGMTPGALAVAHRRGRT